MAFTRVLSVLAFSSLFLGGCASSDVPGQTMADATLKRDILQNIRSVEVATTGSTDVKVIDTTHEHNAAGVSHEVWTVSTGGVESKYDIVVTPSPQGGSDLKIRKIAGPTKPVLKPVLK